MTLKERIAQAIKIKNYLNNCSDGHSDAFINVFVDTVDLEIRIHENYKSWTIKGPITGDFWTIKGIQSDNNPDVFVSTKSDINNDIPSCFKIPLNDIDWYVINGIFNDAIAYFELQKNNRRIQKIKQIWFYIGLT